MTRQVMRHVGVFCLLLALGGGLGWAFLPLRYSVGVALLAAVVLFMAYLGVSAVLASRRPLSPSKGDPNE
ncbi:hypothetical protein [Phenylobacterium aquaticum]|uniref:hypothetical protein n=1 Tax=Phenylobacterium aquaticum TaxID=1763816 RepID=UPI001F5DECC3|nr:hypothetical protein [Phenylobacterium aquaticum]MCI3132444.1 hypothetical protein [Phenylobacterium aquaticum]